MNSLYLTLEPGNHRHSVDYELQGITENIKRDHVNSLLNISKYPQCFAGSHTLLRETLHTSDSIEHYSVILKGRYLLNNTRCMHIHTQDFGCLLFLLLISILTLLSVFCHASPALCAGPTAGAYEVCVYTLESFSREKKGNKREHEHLLQSICCPAYSANTTWWIFSKC